MEEFYTLNVAGLTRILPICKISETISMAAFVMFSDVELTVACAKELVKRVPKCDMIITAESKGIPLAYEMARTIGKNYIVARKHSKLYMQNPIYVDVKSISTSKVQTLCLDEKDMKKMDKQRILIVDDVISTGGSLHALEQIIKKTGGIVVGKAAVLAEGDAIDRKDIIFLEKLPIIKNTKFSN